MKKIHGTHTILSIKQVCAKFVQIAIESPQLAKTGRPGQFLNVRVSDGSDPLLRRPFGIYRAQDNIVEMLVEIRGRGTAILAKKKPGETLDILGPLGRPFTLPAPQVKQVILIGGGIGVAPLLAMAQALKDSGKQLILLYGARNSEYLFDLKYFSDAGCDVHVATDDGSAGKKGRVPVLFEKIFSNDACGAPGGHALHVGSDAPGGPKNNNTMIYTCGPGPMMKSVQAFAKERGIAGECSCEEVMACGTGACRGCAVNTIHGIKTACHDGPVFDLQEVIF